MHGLCETVVVRAATSDALRCGWAKQIRLLPKPSDLPTNTDSACEEQARREWRHHEPERPKGPVQVYLDQIGEFSVLTRQ